MSTEGDSTESVRVQARVPEYQKSEWKSQADELDMSLSEFVRTMVQAGRSGFEGDEIATSEVNPVEGSEGDADPGGGGLETRVQAVLREEGPVDWDRLVQELSGDFEERLEEALDALQDEGRVKHSGPEGGYVLTDGGA